MSHFMEVYEVINAIEGDYHIDEDTPVVVIVEGNMSEEIPYGIVQIQLVRGELEVRIDRRQP